MLPAADPDEDLIRRVAVADPAAVQALMDRKRPRMVSLARRLLNDRGDAEDVAQEVLLRAWRQAAVWQPGVGKFDTWIHRVALNLCYDRLRRRREDPTAEPPERPDPSSGAEAGLMILERTRRVAQAVAALPSRQKEAVMLCHYQELTNIEASERMGVSVEAVESLLSRGRRALKTALMDLRL